MPEKNCWTFKIMYCFTNGSVKEFSEESCIPLSRSGVSVTRHRHATYCVELFHKLLGYLGGFGWELVTVHINHSPPSTRQDFGRILMKFCPNYAENRVFGEKTPFFSAKIATFHMIFSRVRRGVNGYLKRVVVNGRSADQPTIPESFWESVKDTSRFSMETVEK